MGRHYFSGVVTHSHLIKILKHFNLVRNRYNFRFDVSDLNDGFYNVTIFKVN